MLAAAAAAAVWTRWRRRQTAPRQHSPRPLLRWSLPLRATFILIQKLAGHHRRRLFEAGFSWSVIPQQVASQQWQLLSYIIIFYVAAEGIIDFLVLSSCIRNFFQLVSTFCTFF
jgi:hypothetical protein